MRLLAPDPRWLVVAIAWAVTWAFVAWSVSGCATARELQKPTGEIADQWCALAELCKADEGCAEETIGDVPIVEFFDEACKQGRYLESITHGGGHATE